MRPSSRERQLQVADALDFTNFPPARVKQQRLRILEILHWKAFNATSAALIAEHVQLQAQQQIKPELVFSAAIDVCWKQRIELPTHHQLADVITDSFNIVESALLTQLEQALHPSSCDALDALLLRPTALRPLLGDIKTISQSLRAKDIQQSVESCLVCARCFTQFESCYDKLEITEKATEYYATWVKKATVAQLQQFPNRRKRYLHLLAFIQHQYCFRQDLLMDIVFDRSSSEGPLLDAVMHFQATDGHLGNAPPLTFMSAIEQSLFTEGEAQRTSLYKILLFQAIAVAVRAGKLNLRHSYRYRAIQDYLIPMARWSEEREQLLTLAGLESFADGTACLAELKTSLSDGYRKVNDRYQSGENEHLSMDDNGYVRVRTPGVSFSEEGYVGQKLTENGIVPVLQILREIDQSSQFIDCFKHLSPRHHKLNPGVETILAGILGKGCNIGIDKLSQISLGLNENTLKNTVTWCFTLKNIQAANTRLLNGIGQLALANAFKSDIHSTDTHGFTEAIFAATHLIDTAFAPRIKRMGGQRLYSFSSKATHQRKGDVIVPSRIIDQKLILKHWDDILRFMATIKLRHSSASQLFKRLSSYASDHPLYKALKEFGRLIKTQFILTYYDDLELRQRIEKQLNKVELSNRFTKAVFFANNQEFQDGSREEQEIATACNVLIQNAIVFWNALFLSQQLSNKRTSQEQHEMLNAITSGSLLTWQHVNLQGEYDFRHVAANEQPFDICIIMPIRCPTMPADTEPAYVSRRPSLSPLLIS